MWQIKVYDPSGETRVFPIKPGAEGIISMGNDPVSEIPLRDPTLPKRVATLSPCVGGGKNEAPFWIKVSESTELLGAPPTLRLGDLTIKEAALPPQFPLSLGETVLELLPYHQGPALPVQPSGIRAWLTCSEAGRSVLWMTKKSAATPLSLYLAGETGTGKEVLAHLIHAWSERASGPFVPLHCGALPLSLAESELFGHVKGAFTGAISQRPGALMQAHNGTLFLDEVGDLPLDIQVKLLRFLENGEIKPVGADRCSKSDVRIICATHHPLQKLVEEGKFRRDLYYRLASVTIDIPPLRDRLDDIELLSRKFAEELHRTLTPRAVVRLKAHPWPGNVRELRHAVERACGLAGPFGTVLGEDAFSFLMDSDSSAQSIQPASDSPILTLEEMERVMLLKALKIARGNRANAAKFLGIARSTLFEMIKRHKIKGPRSQSEYANTDLNFKSSRSGQNEYF